LLKIIKLRLREIKQLAKVTQAVAGSFEPQRVLSFLLDLWIFSVLAFSGLLVVRVAVPVWPPPHCSSLADNLPPQVHRFQL
jgi:hypothetical protein